MTQIIFEDFQHPRLEISLPNRIVMAPMTRSRAIDNIPNDIMREYYVKRASTGLIISEGIATSIHAHGYPRVPGIYTPQQMAAWTHITKGLKNAGGRMFAQLWHVGRVAHPDNQPPNARILSPSAQQIDKSLYVDTEEGYNHMKKHIPLSEMMRIDEIIATEKEFIQSAQNAIDSGFQGVELHAANGYLFQQFINPHSNIRNDQYGGNIEGRTRLLIETTAAVSKQIGAHKVGVRLSPFSEFSGLSLYPDIETTYKLLIQELENIGIAYIHFNAMDEKAKNMLLPLVHVSRKLFQGVIIICGNYNFVTANRAIEEGVADLVAIGRPFIANPDLLEKWKNGEELLSYNTQHLYSAGREGYI